MDSTRYRTGCDAARPVAVPNPVDRVAHRRLMALEVGTVAAQELAYAAAMTLAQRNPSPDPVASPKEYQDMLRGLVGLDDPDEAQTATPGMIRALIGNAGADLRTRPEEGEWSVLECIAHIVDAEVVASGRYRWILAHDQPELIGYDQDLWINSLHRPPEEPNELLAHFEPMRRANLALWRRTTATQRDRVGIHRERGPESYELTFVLIAGHDRFHLAQARRALETVRASR